MIIKNVKLIDVEGFSNVKIEDGKISAIENDLERLGKDEDIIDGNFMWLLPGIIDLNVCLKNYILSQKHLQMLCDDAKKGGVSTCVIMPNYSPQFDNKTFLEFLNAGLGNLDINILMIAPLIRSDENQLNNLATLIEKGACAIQGVSSLNANLIKRGLQYANMKKKPLFCNCYEPDFDNEGVMNDGKVAFSLGLRGISKISEISEVAKMCEVAYDFDAPVLFQALSTKRSLELVKMAKDRGANVMSEVSIHHLCKEDSQCKSFNTNAKIRPPLREKGEREALIEMLQKGYIDILSSIHSPRSVSFKDVAFEQASFGIHSICEYFSIAHTYLVSHDLISLEKLTQLTSLNPASILGLKSKGCIKVGFDADMILFDDKQEWKLEQKDFIYKNEILKGKIKATFVGGKRIF